MSVISASEPRESVYVHSHFQHFQRTIEENSLVRKTDRIGKKIAKGINIELRSQIGKISDIESQILDQGYKNHKGDLRKFYKEQVRVALGPNTLAGIFIENRSTKASIDAGIKAGFAAVNQNKGISEKAYISSERVKFNKFLQDLQQMVTNLYSDLENVYGGNLQNLFGLPGMVARAQNAVGKTFAAYESRKDTPTFAIEKIKVNIKKLERVRSISGYNKVVGKIFSNVNETIYEMVTAFSVYMANLHGEQAITKTFAEAIATGLITPVGAGGGSNKPIGTTDVKFTLGEVVIG